jgi:hypothetical protein
LLLVTRRMTNHVSNILRNMTNGTRAENVLLKGSFYMLFLFMVIYSLAVVQYLFLKYPDRTITIDGFGGLVVCVLASSSRIRGFEPGRSRWIFSV